MIPKINSLIWLVPALAGAYGFTSAKGKDARKAAALMAAVGVGGYLLSNKEATDDQVFEDVPTDSNYNAQLVNSVVADLSTTLLSYGTTGRCEALERYFNVANDNDFKVIANQFKTQNQQTIRNAINATYDDGCYVGTPEFSDLVVERLNNLLIP